MRALSSTYLTKLIASHRGGIIDTDDNEVIWLSASVAKGEAQHLSVATSIRSIILHRYPQTNVLAPDCIDHIAFSSDELETLGPPIRLICGNCSSCRNSKGEG